MSGNLVLYAIIQNKYVNKLYMQWPVENFMFLREIDIACSSSICFSTIKVIYFIETASYQWKNILYTKSMKKKT